jgi:hypothetical protein
MPNQQAGTHNDEHCFSGETRSHHDPAQNIPSHVVGAHQVIRIGRLEFIRYIYSQRVIGSQFFTEELKTISPRMTIRGMINKRERLNMYSMFMCS